MTDRMVPVGPCVVQTYPPKAWTQWPEGLNAREVWKICGPTVEQHLDRIPLWQVFCVLYIEGLQHGSELAKGTKP